MIRRDREPQVGCLVALTVLTAAGTVWAGWSVICAAKSIAALVVGAAS